jgi:apolipoprotein N-acyltransferase
MQKLLNNPKLCAVISGLLTYYAICHFNFICSWICYIPLFISVFNKSAKQAFKTALIFGFTFSCLAFFWMIPGAERFTGYNILYVLGVFLVSDVF